MQKSYIKAQTSQTPITAMGCRQCLPLSVVQLKSKHCRKPHCRNGIVDTIGPRDIKQELLYFCSFHGDLRGQDFKNFIITTLHTSFTSSSYTIKNSNHKSLEFFEPIFFFNIVFFLTWQKSQTINWTFRILLESNKI